jgi:hypothetical protein
MPDRSRLFYSMRLVYRVLKPLINRFHIRSAFLNVSESRELRISYTTPVRTLKTFLLLFKPLETEHQLERIGGNDDGGYLVPKLELSEIDACFSIGCNFVWDFEKEIGENYGVPSVIVDDFSKKPNNLSPLQTFFPSWLGKFSNDKTISLGDLIKRSNFSKSENLLLQMDIEGSEFECLLHTQRDVLQQFRIMVIEIHNLQNILHHHIFLKYYYPFMKMILEDFEVVHVHPNNACSTWEYKDIRFPEVIEVTFLRRDRIKAIAGYAELPHKLDQLNAPDNPPILINWESLL